MPTLRSVLFCLVAVSPVAVAQSGNIDLLSFAMPGAKIVAGAHVDTAKSSTFGQYVLSQIQSSNPALQKFIEETGVDPRTDVREVVVATDGMPGPSIHALVAIHGTFSNAISVLETSAQSHGGTITHLSGGVDLIRMENGEAKEPHPCIALYLDAATAVIGDCDSVQAGIASASPNAPAGTALFTTAAAVRGQQDLWFASVLPAGKFAMGVPSELNPLLNSQLIQAIQQTSGGVKFAAGSSSQAPSVQVSGAALMDTPQNATSLMNVVKFFASMIQMRGANEPDAAPFLSLLGSLQTSVSGSTLNVSLSIPEATLEDLFQRMPQRASSEPVE